MGTPVSPIGSYDPARSRKKAWQETASSAFSAILPALMALLLLDEFRSAVMDLVKDNPKAASAVTLAFLVLRFMIKFYWDKQKHSSPAYHLEHGVPAAKAEALAVASGAEPKEAKAETKAAVAELATEKAVKKSKAKEAP